MGFPCPFPQAVTAKCTESGPAGGYLGSGDPVRVLACGMDESCIRGDGEGGDGMGRRMSIFRAASI